MSPSLFIVEWIDRIAGEYARLKSCATRDSAVSALDVAMGSGRHAVPLARAGFTTFGMDIREEPVRAAIAAGRAEGVTIRGWCADLTQHPLPRGRFDLVVVCRYLQRDLFDDLRAAVTPGGIVIYETFTTKQRDLGRPPASADHLLEPDELRRRFDGFELLFYEEVATPDAVARLVARSRR